MVSSCMQLALDPGTSTTPDTQSSAASFAEVVDNPQTSTYYTEPQVPYGAPDDGVIDNSDADHYLASFRYTGSSGSATPTLIAGAVKHAGQTLLVKPGIVGTGTAVAADGSQHVMVFAATAEDAKSVPAQIDGVKTEVRVTGRIKALAGYTDEYRPIVPSGVSVGNSRENSSGTLGAIVVKNGIRYALSNNHVLARENKAVIGEAIVQPGRADNRGQPTGQIGVLSAYKKVNFNGTNEIDAAVARLTTTNEYDQADQFLPSRYPAKAQVGMQVMKVGRTTGITYGTVAATDVTIKVDYDGQTATFVNQIFIEDPNFIQAGDSGSLLVSSDGNHPVGLCFAGGTDGGFANPIAPILSFFGVQIAGTDTP